MSDGHPYETRYGADEWEPRWDASARLGDPGHDLGRSRRESDDSFGPAEALPPAQLLARARRLAEIRCLRDAVFGTDLFLNPAWNILLELFIAAEEGRNVTIKSACVAAGVPQSTALRHIAHLIDVRLAVRAQHPSDARSAYLKLSDSGRNRMASFLSLSAEGSDAPGA